jgi:hypothetical protein
LDPLNPLSLLSFLSYGIIAAHIFHPFPFASCDVYFYYYSMYIYKFNCLELNHSSYTHIFVSNIGIKTRGCYIYSLRKKGIILLLGDFNDRTTINKAIILSNDSNPNLLWLNDDLVLAIYKRNSRDLIENLFGTKLIKI